MSGLQIQTTQNLYTSSNKTFNQSSWIWRPWFDSKVKQFQKPLSVKQPVDFTLLF